MKFFVSALQTKRWLIVVLLISLLVPIIIGAAFRATSSYYDSGHSYPEKADFSNLKSSRLGSYYVNTEGKNIDLYNTFDRAGIPVLYYYDIDDNIHYNPVTVSQYALENWELYLATMNEKYKSTFLKQADWLLARQNSSGGWEYHFPLKTYKLKPPWVSGMAQGQGISVLLRAYQVTQQEKYLSAAKLAMSLFQKTVREGGVAVFDSESTWFEEYPSHTPSYVFNGHIWALFGIYDYFRVTKEKQAHWLFDQGIEALIHKLDDFDRGYWVLYDLYDGDDFVDRDYLNLQVEQLKILFSLTREDSFNKTANRWSYYQVSKWNRIKLGLRVLPYKIWQNSNIF